MAHVPPGVLTQYGRTLREPFGRVHWAGTETATVSHGTIDGAVRSGIRAAEEVETYTQ
jgi:monoamine oxidase